VYRCACEFSGTLDDVIKHVGSYVHISKDGAQSDSDHRVMLRAMREERERQQKAST